MQLWMDQSWHFMFFDCVLTGIIPSNVTSVCDQTRMMFLLTIWLVTPLW